MFEMLSTRKRLSSVLLMVAGMAIDFLATLPRLAQQVAKKPMIGVLVARLVTLKRKDTRGRPRRAFRNPRLRPLGENNHPSHRVPQ